MKATRRLDRLNHLLVHYLGLPSDRLRDDTTVNSLCVAQWRWIDLAIAVESEFGVPMSADDALKLETIGAWRALVRD